MKKEFEKIVKKYILAFEKKHNIIFDNWVGNNIGEIAFFGDYFINFDDIRFDIDNDIKKEKFFEWYDLTLDSATEGKPLINYKNYCKL